MTPNQIQRVLSTLLKHEVRFLLMGGQACILYGAAEFSRDVDVTILLDEDNLERLEAALDSLQAERVYVPELSQEMLNRGHACHFRCGIEEVRGSRIDVMARMRGVDDWENIWTRRSRISLPGVGEVSVLGLPDLVQAKKTQRDKDWPMIRRLLEADILGRTDGATPEDRRFWLRECRTPALLIELVSKHPDLVPDLAERKEVLAAAAAGDPEEVRLRLRDEEDRERRLDQDYWRPLKDELQRLRREEARSKE